MIAWFITQKKKVKNIFYLARNCDFELNDGSWFPPVFLFVPPADIPDQVIRVFKADQQSCYIIISKDTTAKDVVAHAVNEFGLSAAPESYSLCEVSVSPEGVTKQRRLPDQLSKLADRIQLNGR